MIADHSLSPKLINLFPHQNTPNPLLTDVEPETIKIKAQQEWDSAIASLQQLLQSVITQELQKTVQGLVISSPTPVIKKSELLSHLETAVLSPNRQGNMILPPSTTNHRVSQQQLVCPITIPLQEKISLNNEEFCLVFTSEFSCLLVKSKNQNNQPIFQFSFDPSITNQAWLFIKNNLLINHHYQQNYLEDLTIKFTPQIPNYQIVSNFTNYLMENMRLIEFNKVKTKKLENKLENRYPSISLKKTPLPPYPEIELLQALTHEIRTPLTSIKTLTKLLQKKAKSNPELVKYLEMIEQECTEQINRMDLIFRVAELEATPQKQREVNLVPICLEQILEQTIPIWKRQAQRRNIILDFIVPQKLPQVVSDPVILSQMLGGIMEKFTRNIPSGGKFKVLVLTAGNQLKLQFLSESNLNNNQVKCLGKLLLFQPETGSLSLNPDVTKHIFHVLGGKLIIKQKQDKGEILTVFLPLGNPKLKKQKTLSYTNS